MTRMVDLSPGARALVIHQKTTGMAVTMGWTCACGVYCDTEGDKLEHIASEVIKAERENE